MSDAALLQAGPTLGGGGVIRVRLLHAALWLLLLIVPAMGPSSFWVFQIGAQSLLLGTIALSTAWLMAQAGIVSLAQLSIAGVAGYGVALLGTSTFEPSLGWPWYVAVPAAVALGTLAAALVGWMAARTEGLQAIMLTLAIAVAAGYFAQQNQPLLNGFNGISGTQAPVFLGIDLAKPTPFYWLCLATAAVCIAALSLLSGTVFGLATRGVRNDARKLAALGFDVHAYRIAAFAAAGAVASMGGVLRLWFNGQISSGSIGFGPVIDILLIAMIGGTRHPYGAYAGALVVVLLQTFASDFVGSERFRLLSGAVFLVVMLTTRDGLIDFWDRLRHGAAWRTR
jgi:branched-chain amino acid transport system permease protein